MHFLEILDVFFLKGSEHFSFSREKNKYSTMLSYLSVSYTVFLQSPGAERLRGKD